MNDRPEYEKIEEGGTPGESGHYTVHQRAQPFPPLRPHSKAGLVFGVAASLILDPVGDPEGYQRIVERKARQAAAKAPRVGKKLKARTGRKAAKTSKRKNRR